MFPAETFRDTLARLATILTRFGVRFHLTGGVSTIAYGEPRMTQDVDIVVDPRSLAARLGEFLVAVEAAGFLVDEETTRKAVAEAGRFQLLDLVESLKIDLYPREMIPGELDRSVPAEVFAGLFPADRLPCRCRPFQARVDLEGKPQEPTRPAPDSTAGERSRAGVRGSSGGQTRPRESAWRSARRIRHDRAVITRVTDINRRKQRSRVARWPS